MSEKLDQALQGISELTELMRERQKTEVQWDEVKTEFQDKIDEMVEARFEEAQAKQPQRRVPGQTIGPDNERDVEALKGNRYYRMLKDFQNDGHSKRMGKVIKPLDLFIARGMMDVQLKHYADSKWGPAPQSPSDDLDAALKALSSDGSGTGDEYVPQEMRAQLWDDFFLASRVAGTITNVPMPTNPFDIPLGLGDVTWRKGSENTATTASDPATAKSTLTATELITEQNWSYTLEEDAIVAMAPQIRSRLAQSGGEIIDDFILNADATDAANGNINSDDSDPANDSYYLSEGQDGIRHQWLVDNTDQTVNAGGDALADADFTDALTAMGKYAVDPMRVVAVCDVSTYLNGFLTLDNVVTVDKFGPNAVVLNGQLASYRGVPIVVSASHRLAEADGKRSDTESNNTLGSISIYNRNMWYVGFLRDLLIEMDRDIRKRQFILVTSLREAVAAHGTRSGNTHTAGIRNILV